MKKYFYFLLLLFIVVAGCRKTTNIDDIEKWKSEIMDVEKEFNDMAQEKGLTQAFKFYAAPDGVIRRNKKIIQGKKAIEDWYKNDIKPNETLTWKPTFIDISESGDMAYTYGDYIFTYLDSLGMKKESKGIFHTVWKRQDDGTWRFVWD